ncbi:hypothetical protein ACFL49_03080, partial [Candidatus Omnitrophota bacterium]
MKRIQVTFILCLLIIIGITSNQAHAGPFSRDEVIEQALNYFSEHTIDVNIQRYYYRYAEPNLMKEQDYMQGASIAYTYRPTTENFDYDIRNPLALLNNVDMLRAEGKYCYGLLDYDSEGTGESQNDPYHVLELRGLVGRDLATFKNTLITPYLGFGYRYLKDDSGGTTTSTGHASYDRESNYFYIPIGVESYHQLTETFALKLTAEYDHFLFGRQISHLEDASPYYETTKNDQKDGYGARGSIRLIKQFENVDLYIEPFVNFWKIEDSERSNVIFNGVVIGTGIEPDNNTTEYGFKLGA